MAMTISLNQLGSRYRTHWVFKGLDYTFDSGGRYALLGANGSGKSTLMRIVAGMQGAAKGSVQYALNGNAIAADSVFGHLGYCAPGMDIVEEMTLLEFLRFHFSFKKTLPPLHVQSIIALMDMQDAGGKMLHEFSSGMKQRVKLAQAFFSDTPLLLLDEPCSNLDQKGVAMYEEWLAKFTTNRTVIIASNDEREYPGVVDTIALADYK
ncbi:MAG: ATP-binding cassette domain-containing protein [Edaphocola sp.]